MSAGSAAALALLAALVAAGTAAAQQSPVLTLAEALAAADAPHPDLRIAEAERAEAAAEEIAALGPNDWSVNLEAGLRQADPQGPLPGADPWLNDNSVRVLARKTLLDFGRTERSLEAARRTTASRVAGLVAVREARRIEIMERFFAVLLADLEYSADNEFMAVAYVDFDHGRERFEVGAISRVELAALEARYQDILERRNASRSRQRVTRALLAQSMNRPGQLPAELQAPALPGNERALPEVEALRGLMLERNPRMQAARHQLEASRERLAALRLEQGPTIGVELEAGEYAQVLGARDNNLRAGVVLNWPLYQGARLDARLAREQAQFQKLQALADRLAMELDQTLLELWTEIEQLQKTSRRAAQKNAEYRDLALERARGEYETELKTNLGNSMAETMSAQLRERRTEYRLALALARLEALLGQPLPQAKKE